MQKKLRALFVESQEARYAISYLLHATLVKFHMKIKFIRERENLAVFSRSWRTSTKSFLHHLLDAEKNPVLYLPFVGFILNDILMFLQY